MTPRRRELVLFAILFFVLLVTGCSSQLNAGNTRDSSPQNVTSVPANATIVPVQPVSADNKLCTIIAQGDDFIFPHRVPEGISVKNEWLFLNNNAGLMKIPLEQNASSNFTSTILTDGLRAGNYRLVIHFPGSKDSFDIRTINSNKSLEAYHKNGSLLFDIKSVWNKKMTGFEAADILEQEIRKPGMRDTSTSVNFTVQVPVIRINPVGDHHPGDIFEINGTTNMAAGNTIIVQTNELYGCRYSPSTCANLTYPGFEGTATVQGNACGDMTNTWSVIANLSDVHQISSPDEEWIITAEANQYSAVGYAVYKMFPLPPEPKITDFSVIRGDSFIYLGEAPAPAISIDHSWRRIRDDPAYMTKVAVNEVRVWIFGEHYVNMMAVTVNPYSPFNLTLDKTRTAGLPAGNYRILLQYPQYQDLFDITVRDETGRVMNRHGDLLFMFADIRDLRMTGFTAADIFERELKKSDAMDRYEILTLDVTDS